jgi:hypothetical protein
MVFGASFTKQLTPLPIDDLFVYLEVMRNKKTLNKLAFLPLILLSGAGYSQTDDLYRTIVKLDSTFFQAYNNCDLATQERFYSDSIEFFHDKSGLETSKKNILASTKKYICGKVTRELVKGSIEVSPLPGYGAVELGEHMFHNNQEKNNTPHASKFVIIWRNNNSKWTITKVISLH